MGAGTQVVILRSRRSKNNNPQVSRMHATMAGPLWESSSNPRTRNSRPVVVSSHSSGGSSSAADHKNNSKGGGVSHSNHTNTTTTVFVRHSLKHYYRPALEDRIIGTVIDRVGVDSSTGGELYRVHIQGSHTGTLSSLAFEGATKRNRPVFQPGHVLYCRVASLHTSLDPVLSCILGPNDVGIPRKDWMTNEGAYGELRGGTLCRISTGLARDLLHPHNVVLAELSRQQLAFEVAIGVNGYLWIHSPLPSTTIVIQNAIQNSAVLTDEQVRTMVKSLLYTMKKQIQKDRDAMEE